MAEQVKIARDKYKELEVALTKLGFDLGSDDSVTLAYNEGRKLREKIDARVEKELGTSADIDARFDSTQLAMMTVASLQDAEKLLKSVTTI